MPRPGQVLTTVVTEPVIPTVVAPQEDDAFRWHTDLAGDETTCAALHRRVLTVSVLVLRGTPGSPHLPPNPLPLPQGERKREGGVAGDKEHWKPGTQWLHGYGTRPIRNPGF